LCRERKEYSKNITTTQQANNPNNEVPPQDAQLQGVISMASKQVKKPPQARDVHLLVNYPQCSIISM
jgi:hypothetical protein